MKKIIIIGVLLLTSALIAQSRLPEAYIDNLFLDGNTISSTNTNGDVNVSPNGTGTVVINTDLDVDNLNLNGNEVSSTNTNGDITLSPNGTGTVVINTDLDVDNLNFNGNTISSTSGGITIDPSGSSDFILNDLTASRVLVLDGSKAVQSSVITSTELGYLDDVTSALCGINQSCTLTNKTLTTPSVNTGINVLAEGYVRLQDASGGEYVGIKAPATVTSYSIVMPAAQGTSGQTLSNDGSGNLVWAAGGGGGGVSNAEYNFLISGDGNSKFEEGVAGWTGSTTAPVSETTTEIEGDASLSWTPAGAETLRSDAAVIPAWAYGTNCYAEVYYTLGAVEYSLKVLDGSDVEVTSSGGVATDTNAFAALSGESAIAYRTFICPSSGSVKLSLETSGAAAEINIDRAYIGQNFRMSEALDSTIYSALVTDGAVTTTVSNESQNFIEGNCTNPSGGVYVCTFVSGIFNSVTPNCVATGEEQQQTRITASSASSITVNQLNGGGTASDGDFRVLCQRGAGDYSVKQSTAPLLVNSVVNPSAGVTQIVSARITNSGTPTITSQDGSWISSLTDNGAGDTSVNIASGTFSSAPRCFLASSARRLLYFSTEPSTSLAQVITANPDTPFGLNDVNFDIMCIGAK